MKKNLIIILSIMMAFATAFTAFAAINTTNETKFENGDRLEKKALPENVVFGKIKSIDANSVTIEVATRKEMERPKSGKNNDNMRKPPENAQGNSQNGNPPEKPNLDNMFTLTGETKTINISQAEFGRDFRPKDLNANAQGNNSTNKANDAKTKTYADYAVGDYIMIEATDNTYATAKSVRDAGFGGGMRGMGGRNDKKTPPNN